MRKTIWPVIFVVASMLVISGCGFSQQGGNRRGDAPMITRVSDLKNRVGKRVTLVGTAASQSKDGAVLSLRDGDVALPAYDWPKDFEGKSVMVIGTVAPPLARSTGGKEGPVVQRLGDIELAERWSR